MGVNPKVYLIAWLEGVILGEFYERDVCNKMKLNTFLMTLQTKIGLILNWLSPFAISVCKVEVVSKKFGGNLRTNTRWRDNNVHIMKENVRHLPEDATQIQEDVKSYILRNMTSLKKSYSNLNGMSGFDLPKKFKLLLVSFAISNWLILLKKSSNSHV